MRSSCVALIALAALSSGCPSPAPTPDSGTGSPEDELFARYPPRVLPWALRLDAEQQRGIIAEGERFDHAMLGAAVALPGRAVVIFPPADSQGFVVAWAGLDAPWQRLELPGLTFANTAVIDAEPDATGAVHIAARTLNPRAIEYFVWKDGALVSQQRVPLQVKTTPLFWLERCHDLRVGVAPDGTVDLVYREDPNDVVVARRPTGATAFTPQLAMRRSIANGISEDVGCRNRIAYDESGRPVVTTLVEFRPIIEGTSRAYAHEKDLRTVVLDGKGRWLPDGPRINGESLALHGLTWRGDFDLARSREGVVTLAGVGDGDVIRAIPWATRVDALPTAYPHFGKFIAPKQGWGGALTVNSCGGLSIVSDVSTATPIQTQAPPETNDNLEIVSLGSETAFDSACPAPREAPVVWKADEPPFTPSSVLASHGLHAPYSMALCGTGHGVLAICRGFVNSPMGRFPGGGRPAPSIHSAQVLSSSPANGAVDVPTDLARITLETREEGFIEWIVTNPGGLKEPVEVTRSGNRVTLTLQGPLHPGRTYRVAPTVSAVAHDQPLPVITFTTAGELYGPAPVPIEFQFICAAPNMPLPDGGCAYPEKTVANDAQGFVDLFFTEPVADPMPTVVQLEALSGPLAVVPTMQTISKFNGGGQLRMKWIVPLELETEYRVVFPKTNPSAWNEWLTQDAVVSFVTTPRPITLTEATPANGSTVAADTPVRLTFSKPPLSLLAVSQAVQLTVMQTGTVVPLSWLAESPIVFRADHAPLTADTAYVLTVNPVADARNTRTTAVTNQFRTVP